MKPTKILFCIIALGTMAFAAGKVSAEPGYLTVSGIATSDKSTTTGRALVKKAFTTKDVLVYLANGTGQPWISNSTSHLVYDPYTNNAAAAAWYGESVRGIFWVTNTTSHNFYRLDNADTNTTYWSYIEIDYDDQQLGFWDPYQFSGGKPLGENWAETYVNIGSRNTGQEIGSDAIFYVHDYLYDFDYVDNGGNDLFDNHGIVLRGPITIGWNYSGLKGSDSIIIKGAGDGRTSASDPVITGQVVWSAKF